MGGKLIGHLNTRLTKARLCKFCLILSSGSIQWVCYVYTSCLLLCFMPKPALACHRAAHRIVPPSVQHVWITDEVLAIAFHHFLRVTFTSQRRYGSNVPGPLEARRRASKRRIMGLAAAGGGGGAPSVGALFGLGSREPRSWRYEPPSIGNPKEQLEPRMCLTATLEA